MFIKIAFCMALVGQLSIALPLESPSSDHKQFFDSRIIGGTVAPPGSTPNMVALLFGTIIKSFLCGGSIITKSHILTAAHCITAISDWHGNLLNSAHAVIGTNTWNHGGVVVEFKSYKNHPQYNQALIKNDVGLLFLEKPMKFSANIQPVRLNSGWVGGGVPCYVTGWGTNELFGNVPYELHMLHVDTISPKECLKLIADYGQIVGYVPPMDPQLEICTLHSPGFGMCHGDSGSALMLQGTNIQVGVVSWGAACALGLPDMYARVSTMCDFLSSATGLGNCGQP